MILDCVISFNIELLSLMLKMLKYNVELLSKNIFTTESKQRSYRKMDMITIFILIAAHAL